MQESDQPVLIYTTFPSAEAAEETGGALVDEGLAACVNILPAMTSLYIWKGERQKSDEAVMVIKTRAALSDAVAREVKARHAYENPAILVLPVAGGSPDFIAWIMSGTNSQRR